VIARLILGGLYIWAGAAKLFHVLLFKATIAAYFPFPDFLVVVIAIVFPWVEITAGLSLILNWKTLYSSGFLFLLSLFFFVQMILHYSNILPYGCGCFGFGGAEQIGVYHILRDLGIVLLAGFVLVREWKNSREQR